MIPITGIVGAFFDWVFAKASKSGANSNYGKEIDPSIFKMKHAYAGALRKSLLLIVAGSMEEVAYFSMIFIFGGASLALAYLPEEKQRRKISTTPIQKQNPALPS